MRAVDANVLVRLLTRDAEEQVHSAEEFVERGAWVSHVVLAETTRVLSTSYDLSRDDIALVIEMLLNHQHLTMQEADVVMEALQRYRQRPSLGFSDCLVVEIARKAGHLPLGTFDRALSRVEGAEKL